LGGRIPAAYRIPIPRQIAFPAHLPVGLRDILARCLEFEPGDRYPDAALLAEDLRRHLSDLPLRGVANRSRLERWRKWRRRRPHALGVIVLLLAVAGGAAFAGVQALRQRDAEARENLRQAEAALREGQESLKRH